MTKLTRLLSALITLAWLSYGASLIWQYYQAHRPIPSAKQYERVIVDLQHPVLVSNVWKISKAGLPDSYLLGTYHKGEKNAQVSPALARLINKVDIVLTEVPEQQSPQEMERLIQQAMKSSIPLNKTLGEQRFAALQQALKRSPQGNQLSQHIHQFKPWAAVLLIMGLEEDEKIAQTGVEAFVHQQAKAQQKPQAHLESHIEASMYFALLSDEIAIATLDDWTNDPDSHLQSDMNLYLAYSQGQFERIPTLFEQTLAYDANSVLNEKQQKIISDWLTQDLLIARNRNWLPNIEQHINQRSTLIAVGFAHLMSNHGLIEMLRQKGYSVSAEPKLLVWE